jgi:uncharacterized protein
MMFDTEFYKDGLRFECTCCGACCIVHGDHAYVYLTKRNVVEIAHFLGMSTDAFYQKFCTEDENGHIILTMEDEQCNFLQERKCQIYPVRPAQCRAWPILTEHLNDKYWNGVLREFCPGIGRGRLYSPTEIETIAKSRDNDR